MGGPIIKNKLLFYTNYEAYRRRAESLANSVILTPDARQGIFTYREQRTSRVQKVNVLSCQAIKHLLPEMFYPCKCYLTAVRLKVE